ncbi:hypothetical protein HMPREF9689_04661, partial [Klebsiella oxytoca 10-5245]
MLVLPVTHLASLAATLRQVIALL